VSLDPIVTCYLCAPDEYPTDDDALDAWNEPCSKCDAEFWADPVYIDYGPGGHP
jgi:hypothetical protein